MSLIYRGTSSDDVHFNVTERRVYNAPAFDVSGIEVPGRSGDILNSQERFKNKAIVYTGFIRSSDFPGDTTWERLSRGLRTIKAWVCGDAGKYHDLTDDYDPGFVRRAFVSGETAISEVLDRPDGATITITFMAEPFMYEESDPIELPETGTASGAIASFEGVAAPLQSLKFNIEPQQDLHGYSNPWPGGGGKNLLNADGFTLNAPAGVNQTLVVDHPVYLEAGVEYTFSCRQTASAGSATRNRICVLPASSTSPLAYEATDIVTAHTHYITYTPSTSGNYRPGYWAHTLGNAITLDQWQVEKGSSPTAYAPYSNISPISGWSQVDGKQSGEDMTDYTPITISLGQTVYGGYVDALNGTLAITQVAVDLGTLTWARGNRNNANTGYIFNTNSVSSTMKAEANAICSIFTQRKPRYSSWEALAVNTFQTEPTSRIVACAEYADAASFTAAMSGVQFVYELATPIEIDLTPVSVSSLLGQNNIWANTGDTEVVYVEPTENPTEWPSKPRLEITMAGAGTLTVNGKTWSIGSYTGALICDSEIMDWYDASNLKNSLVSGDGFPELQPGENVITYTGGITKVVAKPRWRTL